MKLTLREFGGIAGLRARPRAIVDTAALPPHIAEEVESLARVLAENTNAGAPSGDAKAYDRLAYDITVETGGTSITIPPTTARREEFERLRRRLVELSPSAT